MEEADLQELEAGSGTYAEGLSTLEQNGPAGAAANRSQPTVGYWGLFNLTTWLRQSSP